MRTTHDVNKDERVDDKFHERRPHVGHLQHELIVEGRLARSALTVAAQSALTVVALTVLPRHAAMLVSAGMAQCGSSRPSWIP